MAQSSFITKEGTSSRGRPSKHARAHKFWPPSLIQNSPLTKEELSSDPTNTAAVEGLDPKEIIERISEYEKHSSIPVDFDNVTRYGVSYAKAKQLWEKEAMRLIAASKDFTHPLLYEDDSLGPISLSNFEKISEIGQKVYWNIMICDQDNVAIVLEQQRDLLKQEAVIRSFRALERGIQRRPKVLEAGNIAQCHAMINLLTAIVARLAVQAIDNGFWRRSCLATLAKFSTKLKILCQDPLGFAMRSLNNLRNVAAKEGAKAFLEMNMSALDGGAEEVVEDVVSAEQRNPGQLRSQLGQFEQIFAIGEDRSTVSYLIEMIYPRENLFRIASLLLGNLTEADASGLSVGAFEISSLVYRTSFEHSAVALFQDRDGEVMASSSRQILRNAFFSFKNLQQTLKKIKKDVAIVSKPPARSRSGPRSERNASADKDVAVEVMMEWCTNSEQILVDPIKVSSTSHIISLLLPACCTHPLVGAKLMSLNRVCNLTTSGDALRPVPDIGYTAMFTIRTEAYDKENKVVLEGGELRSLSRSLMARHGLHALSLGIDVSQIDRQDEWFHTNMQERLRKIKPRRDKLERLSKKIESDWQIEEKGIKIRRRRYTMGVGLLCLIFVAGGLALGFTLGQRIKGVDPFNITVFCWTFAAFFLVVAKSRLVQDWPWRDFIHGQVVCRSLTELHSVTGVDTQDALAWLLQNELSNVLITRGPYNKLFSRREEEGFSIDCTMELSTMMLSGIIVLEVQTQLGPALVCLNARQGLEYRAFVHSHNEVEDEEELNLACIDPPSKLDPDAVATLQPMHLGWYKVLGVYNVPERRFR